MTLFNKARLQKTKMPWVLDSDQLFTLGLKRLFFLAFRFIIMVYIITEALK